MSDDTGWTTPGGGGAADDPAGGGGLPPPAWPSPEGAPPPPAWPSPDQRPPPPPSRTGGRRPRAGLIPLYPMGVGDVLDTAFRLLRASPGASSLLIVLLIGPVALLSSVGWVSPLSTFQNPAAAAPDTAAVVTAIIGGLLALLVQPLAMGALVWLGARTDEGAVPDWRAALRAGWGRYGHVLGAWALLALPVVGIVALAFVGVLLAGGAGLGIVAVLVIPLALAAVPAVLLAVIVGHLVVPVLVVEEQLGPVQGLRRAWGLMRRRFWAVVGYSLLAGIVFEFLGGAVSFVVSLPALVDWPLAWLFAALSTLVDGLISVPLASFAALAIYVDLRIRTEGYDVSVLAAELRR